MFKVGDRVAVTEDGIFTGLCGTVTGYNTTDMFPNHYRVLCDDGEYGLYQVWEVRAAGPQPEARGAQYHLGFADGYRSGEGCADYRAGFLAGYAQASADD